MIVQFNISKSIFKNKNFYYASQAKSVGLTLVRSLSSVGKVSTSNIDTHNPEQIQQKWYDLWQRKLKEINKKVDFSFSRFKI